MFNPFAGIAQTVVENGRVDQNPDGTLNAASMEAEVEYEAREQGLGEADVSRAVKGALDNPNVK